MLRTQVLEKIHQNKSVILAEVEVAFLFGHVLLCMLPFFLTFWLIEVKLGPLCSMLNCME